MGEALNRLCDKGFDFEPLSLTSLFGPWQGRIGTIRGMSLFLHARHQLDPRSVRANYVGRAPGMFTLRIFRILSGSWDRVLLCGEVAHSQTGTHKDPVCHVQ